MISLIAAIGKNNELGKGNDLLWKFPADQKFFREKTSGHTVIMGRKTFESLGRSPTGEPLGRPLPNRKNIVITRDKNYLRDSVDVAHSLDEALSRASLPAGKAGTTLAQNEDGEIFIIGGAEIYKQAIAVADRLYITHIDAEDKEADAFFPKIGKKEWQEISREEHEGDEKNRYRYTFSVYTKNSR